MGLLSFLGALSPVHIYFVTLTTGARRMGRDASGNTYFQARARKGYNHPRRWVLYKGAAEPSSVPPEWHGWLHYQTDVVPNEAAPSFRRDYQVPHKPNMTGTSRAHLPQGHALKGGMRASTTNDYEAWHPATTKTTTGSI